MNLHEIAACLPGMGGVEAGPFLERLASEVPKGQAIVEVGCWLGAGTAHLALGARQSGACIHVYDCWKANAQQVAHAAKFGVTLVEGEDTLPRVMETLLPFDVRIKYNQRDIRMARWPGGDIWLYVDDASKAADIWERSAGTFLSRVPVGGVAVLMDFHFQPRGRAPLSQVKYMNDRADSWQLEHDRPGGTTAAVFRRRA